MLRARAERGRTTHTSGSRNSSDETGHDGRRVFGDGEGGRSTKVGRTDAGGSGGEGASGRGLNAAGAAEIGTAIGEGCLSGLVAAFVGLESDGVFRAIVGYL